MIDFDSNGVAYLYWLSQQSEDVVWYIPLSDYLTILKTSETEQTNRADFFKLCKASTISHFEKVTSIIDPMLIAAKPNSVIKREKRLKEKALKASANAG